MERLRLSHFAVFLVFYFGQSLFAQDVDTRIEMARQQLDSVIEKARADLIEELDDKLESAKRSGSLERVEALNREKDDFLKTGSLPTSIRTIGYTVAVKRAIDDLGKIYDRLIEEAVKNNQIEKAKKYRDDITTIKDDHARVLAPDQSAMFEVTGGIKEVAPLRLRVEVYSNRNYSWTKIPAKIPFDRFARLEGGGTDQLEYEVSRSGWFYFCLGTEESESSVPFLKKHSWEPSATYLQTNSRGDNKLYVFRKWHNSGEHSLPRLNFSGPIILFPAQDE